jgi:nucleoside-diphosphate-sugar epimerase
VNSTICILGGAGFVGARTMRRLAKGRWELRALVHQHDIDARQNVTIIRGAAGSPVALEQTLATDAVVLNFVYGGAVDARHIAEAVGAACARRRVRRLVHVSSIDVYGATSGTLIDERWPCRPQTEYQRAKHDCEEILAGLARSAYELVILRPTAVFGPGGRNLDSLAHRVLRQPWPGRYLRACAMGRRRIHAVDVEHVAAAVEWAASAALTEPTERFIVGQDEEPDNDYAALEDFFVRRFGAARYPVPVVSPPRAVLRLALRAAGRSDVEPQRVYSSARLAQRGFRGPRSFTAALEEYADWIRDRARS